MPDKCHCWMKDYVSFYRGLEHILSVVLLTCNAYQHFGLTSLTVFSFWL